MRVYENILENQMKMRIILIKNDCFFEKFSHNTRIFFSPMRKHQYRDIICNTCECRHLSAEDIYEEVRVREPKIGRATVYRNIEAMAEE